MSYFSVQKISKKLAGADHCRRVLGMVTQEARHIHARAAGEHA